MSVPASRITYLAALLAAGAALSACTIQVPNAQPPGNVSISGQVSVGGPTTPQSASSSPAPDTGKPKPTQQSGNTQGSTRCTASMLKVDFLQQPPTTRQGTKGITGAEIAVTNTSQSKCTLNGFSGVTFDVGGGPMDTDSAQRVPDPATQQPVLLEPGGAAAENVTWINATAAGWKVGMYCGENGKPVVLDVILPDETERIRVPMKADMVNLICGWYYPQVGPFYYTPND